MNILSAVFIPVIVTFGFFPAAYAADSDHQLAQKNNTKNNTSEISLPVESGGQASLRDVLSEIRQDAPRPSTTRQFDLRSGIQSFNPDISLIISGLYYGDSNSRGIDDIFSSIDGFQAQDAEVFDKGFQIQEVELFLSAAVDPYLSAYSTIVFDEDGAELEEAAVQTTSLPYGLGLKGGKFLSEFSRSNWMHPHDWDFVDRPLVSNLIFGEDGLNQTGLQLSWLAPTDFQLLLGAEFLQGKNYDTFNHLGRDDSDGNLKDHSGPRLMVQWAKFSPYLSGDHETQLGVFHGIGRHQDQWENGAGSGWLDGYSRFFGPEFVYKYDAPYAYGQHNLAIQGEYIFRRRDLDLDAYDADPGLIGNSRVDQQDGYYLQATYGIAPRWRAGLRWDQVGLSNRSRFPDNSRESYRNSHRLATMIDFSPTEFSRFRVQLSRGEYRADGSNEEVYQVMGQMIIALGAHGAHKF